MKELTEYNLKCEICYKNFVVNYKHKLKQRFCGKRCAAIWSNKHRRTGQYKECVNCNKIIYVALYDKKRIFCSAKCRVQNISKRCRIVIKCENKFCLNYFNKTLKSKKRFCTIKCSNIYRSQLASKLNVYKNTKPELNLKNILDKNKIQYKFQKFLPWKKGWKKWYDFYLPKYNLLIEVDGLYWHGKDLEYNQLNNQQKKTRDNDLIKTELASKCGYNLERIWCEDVSLKNIKKIIQKYDKFER